MTLKAIRWINGSMTIRFLIVLLISGAVSASDVPKPEKAGPIDETINPETNTKIPDEKPTPTPVPDQTSRARRDQSQYIVLGNYSYLDSMLPGKIGITAGWVQSAAVTYEVEYNSASVEAPLFIADLGSMSEKKFAFLRKYFVGNSFNISYGLGYTVFDLTLGQDILNRVTSGTYPDMELVRLEALTANFGLGSRWTFSHGITFGVEWLNIAQPISVTKRQHVFLERADNQGDKDSVDVILKFLAWTPRVSLAKIQLGILF